MSDTKTLAASVGPNLPYVKWLLNHVAQLQQIIVILTGIAKPGLTPTEAWTAIKSAGDILVTMLSDFPGFKMFAQNATEEDVQQLMGHSALMADSNLMMNILTYLPQILAIVKLLLSFAG
jgi:hypothetical protein